MIDEYREAKKVQGVTEGTLYEIALTLRNFERLADKWNSKQITQSIIDKFVLQRDSEVKRPTLNKDIRNVKTFINWCNQNRYLNGNFKIKELKEEERPVRSLNDTQIKNLLKVAEPHAATKMRILLALETGLRRGDIDSLKISDIDFEKNFIATERRKTRKSMSSRPIPSEVMAELSKYVCSLDVGQAKLFNATFDRRKRLKICKEAGLTEFKFHDLRKTFGSLLAQNGVSTAVTQRLLEHSSPTPTDKIYTNVDPMFRQSVDRLPVERWL
jgi:integrase